MMGKSLQHNGIRLIIDQPGDDTELLIYENELIHVLINVIKNARDELVEKKVNEGWIKLTGKSDEQTVTFTIEDNGRGIAEQHLLRIFEPYFSTKGENGTGLGLYMSEIIISKNFGGSIGAVNTGTGALFTITFPVYS